MLCVFTAGLIAFGYSQLHDINLGSFLHFGQYSGYWNITISAYTFVLVFPL